MNCRHCHAPLTHVFLDLGASPPSNAYLTASQLNAPEARYPLKVYVCDRCWLVQTQDFASAANLFDKDYAYFSSVSETWLNHARDYSDMIIRKLELREDSFIVEIASNDGYLLKNFLARSIPCLGIEPTRSTALAAEKRGIPILQKFFSEALARELREERKKADLIIGNNVYAHVPDINDFTAGIKTLLKDNGTITLEFPHLMRLIERSQFDTVYHEHFSYLSLSTALRVFKKAGLDIYDVEELTTHGGSIRVYGCHAQDARVRTQAVAAMLKAEKEAGLERVTTYQTFQATAEVIKNNLLAFLAGKHKEGRKVAAYGAAAKGNTLLNFAGVTSELIAYVCDAAPSKQGKFLPGSHIEIVHARVLRDRRPDIVIILPWNIADEIIAQHGYIREWGGQFVTAIPSLKYL